MKYPSGIHGCPEKRTQNQERRRTYTGTLVQGKQTTPHFKLKEREDRPSSEWVRVEGAHEAVIQKHDFDLVQRLRRIDTRTSPKSDKVYLFSGILICGCCGCRMTRKTNRYKDKEYHYYYCPTGKKNGCKSSVMLKESDLTECVQGSLKGHIENGIRNPKPDQLMKIANALGISINVFMDFDIETVSDVLSLILKMDEQLDMNFEAERYEDGSFNPSTIKISFKNSLLNHKLGVYMKARELQENLLNDTERFSSEEEHQRAIEALSKDLDAVKQSILDDSKIVKKGVRGISVKIYPEN